MKIAPYPPFGSHPQDLFLSTIQELLTRIIPLSIQEEMKQGSLNELLKALPLVQSAPISNSFWVTLLCPSNYTHGVGRYLIDAISRWLVPGKTLQISGAASLSFFFLPFPRHQFYVEHLLVQIGSEQDLDIAERNHHRLLEEIRLNILAVYQARYIASLKSVSLEQKQLLMEENVSKIFNLPAEEGDLSPFDEIHRFCMNIVGEEKLDQVRQTLAQLVRARPKAFDRETFYEMTQFTILFKRQFANTRSARHVSRVIALQYLFRKMLHDVNELRIHAKVFTTELPPQVVGVLMAINTSKALDALLLESVRLCIPGCEAVNDSMMIDRRDQKVSLFYVEVQKPGGFLPQEIRALRKALPAAILQLLESEQTLFPRNEEDIARNLIALSQQLNGMTSLPQVIIHYERQSESHFFFSVLLSRLVLPTSTHLRELFLNQPHWSIDELRLIGKFKHKIPKEAACLRVTLDKAPFIRSDSSLDLLRARQKVAAELTQILGNYRDFNGGMILKQQESLSTLRKSIGSMSPETERLLESYFYSLRPGIMQTILPGEVLQAHFLQLQALHNLPFREERIGGFFIVFVRLFDASGKDPLDRAVEALGLPTHELVNCFLKLPQFIAAGYILRTDSETAIEELRTTILESLNMNSMAEVGKRPVH